MNKEKQIEEMAKEIYNLDHCEGYKDDRGCMYAPTCSVCKYGRENKAKQISELLAKQGYRKASEVAREIFEEILEIMNGKYQSVTADCHFNMRYGYTDTPEGMRNTGKAEMLKYIGDKIAELKKKYTESEDTE